MNKYFLTIAGEVVIISVYNSWELNIILKLDEFHKSVNDPQNENITFYLAGVIGYIGPIGVSLNTRPKEGKTKSCDGQLGDVGHYIAYSYRRGNNCWMEANDNDKNQTTKNRSGTFRIVPRLLMHVKKI